MIRNFLKINKIIIRRNFSNDRKLPTVKYIDSSLNIEKIGVNSERKDDEINLNKKNNCIKKRESSHDDLLHLLPINKKK